MDSYLFSGGAQDVLEGTQKPGALTRASGAWVRAAGGATLGKGLHPLNTHGRWVWLAIEEGEAELRWRGQRLRLAADETCVLPSAGGEATMLVESHARCLWFALAGEHAAMVVRRMGALLDMPLRQRATLGQMVLAKQLAQVTARHSGTAAATDQQQHLLYGMLASHWGQPVALVCSLSREITRVIDALRASDYRDNLTLPQMAEIARLPVETFRKRFVAEVGLPPLRYVQRCKMERAKALLREPGATIAQAGAKVGVADPYRFSKLFKTWVGISPTEFMRHVVPDAALREMGKADDEA